MDEHPDIETKRADAPFSAYPSLSSGSSIVWAGAVYALLAAPVALAFYFGVWNHTNMPAEWSDVELFAGSALVFFVYGVLGLTFRRQLSSRPGYKVAYAVVAAIGVTGGLIVLWLDAALSSLTF